MDMACHVPTKHRDFIVGTRRAVSTKSDKQVLKNLSAKVGDFLQLFVSMVYQLCESLSQAAQA